MTVKVGRTPNGRFARGSSGNPGGRPKLPEEVKAGLQKLAGRAIEVLEEAMQSDDERVRVLAAAQCLDRGYGKPVQAITATVETVDMAQSHLRALQALAQQPTAIHASADDEEDPAGPSS